MANVDRPNGLEPIGKPLRANVYTAAEAIYPGDPVSLTAAGKVERASASSALVGVALGLAKADGDEILVADSPDQYFKVQADGSDIDDQNDINLNYNLAATSAAFNTAYQLSRVELDSSTGATTSAGTTLPLKLLGISKEANNALGANVKCVVKINNHQLNGGTGTDGV